MKLVYIIWNFVKKNLWYFIAGLVIFFLFFGGWSRLKGWFKDMRTTGGDFDPEVIASFIHANFHGSKLGFQPNWFSTNETRVKDKINSLPDQKAFNDVVTAYRKSYGIDLREDLVIELDSMYNTLKFK